MVEWYTKEQIKEAKILKKILKSIYGKQFYKDLCRKSVENLTN